MMRAPLGLIVLLGLAACRGERGPAGPPGARAIAPTASEVARMLASDPQFAREVARELAAQHANPFPLPAANAGSTPPAGVPSEAGSRVTVTIDVHGAMTLDGHPVTQAELVSQIRTRVAADPQMRVVIAADRATSHQSTIGVIDSLRTVGVQRFAMAVAPP